MTTHLYFRQLRQMIEAHFDLQDLRELCFDLNINYDNLSGDRLSAKVIALVEEMRKRGQMELLLVTLVTARPHVSWPEWSPEEATAVTSPTLVPLVRPSPLNPFGRTGQIQDLTAYLVRQPLTDAIMYELQKRVSLSIVGPTQTGKSSLLWHITQQGPQKLNIPPEDFVYLSMELVHSETEFFDYICSELGVETSRGFRLARQLKGRRIILCLDEIEKMTWEGFTLNVRTELRGLADGAQAPFTLVIASRSPLGQLFPDSPEMTSPLAGLCMQINMPYFTLTETHALVKHYLGKTKATLPPEAIERAWLATEGHPRRLQVALQETFTRFLEKEDFYE
ncbi:MAG: ATP-binding protein [Anaerolineae bacterium]|nr:ATP-binding protein [Anaerolineae bacterium]